MTEKLYFKKKEKELVTGLKKIYDEKESYTKKRFTVLYGIDENPFEWDLMDNQKDCLIIQGNGIAICDLLNELDENWIKELSLRETLQLDLQRAEEENEQLKQVLGSILLEVKRDITNTNCTGEVKAFINPNSYNLISDVLRRYGALKGWYDD